MKKLFFICSLTLGFSVFSQDFHRCYTHEAMEHQETITPGYINQVNEVFNRAKEIGTQARSDVYTIPVVVHIVYNTPEENLPDSVIFNQIASLNADFRRLNEDAVNVRDTFNTIVGDTFIEFELAAVDPDGNPTNGITRTSTAVESFLADFETLADGVKYTSEGGIDPWDQSRYMNIWVCDMSFFGEVFLLGYATPPDGLEHWPEGAIDGLVDGVVMQYQAFGSNNPNPLIAGGSPIEVLGRTTTHEVGHYLGLRHIWGDGDCSEQDGIDDTPNMVTQSSQDCDIVKNTCVDDIADLGDLPDMVENYMDYSAESCQNSFTLGQANMMRAIIENERIDLVEDNPVLGIRNESQEAFELSLYPNPTSGIVTVSFQGMDSGTDVIVLSETGQIVQAHNLKGQLSTITLENLVSGLYFIQVQNELGLRVEKLVVY
ncbi:zinc-dependent metalloprotease [Crocinitomix sp.]|nr:zinc-dependent metalloprotease [Crocinitomix sp.]